MQRAEREDSHKYDREMQDRNRNLDRNANLNAPTLAPTPKVPAVLGVQALRPFHNFKKLRTSLVDTFDPLRFSPGPTSHAHATAEKST